MVISSALLASSVGPVPLDTPIPTFEPRQDRRHLSRPPTPKSSNKRSHAVAFASKTTLEDFQRNLTVPLPSSQWLLPVIAASSMASHRLTVVVAATAWIMNAIYDPELDSQPPPEGPFTNVRIILSLLSCKTLIVVLLLPDAQLARRFDLCE